MNRCHKSEVKAWHEYRQRLRCQKMLSDVLAENGRLLLKNAELKKANRKMLEKLERLTDAMANQWGV